MQGVLQIPRVQEMHVSLQCSSSNAQSLSTHAKHNSTASSKKRKSHLWNHQFHCARSSRTFHAKAATPETVAQASQLFSVTEAPFTRLNTMFRGNPNNQIASMIRENKAVVRGILRIPRVEAVKSKLSCEASFSNSTR